MSPERFPDRISLLGMRFEARHGVHPHEKTSAQPFEIDLVMHADLSRAAASDDLADTVDYAALYDLVAAIVSGPSRDLLETVAGAIAAEALATTDPGLVDEVEVRIRKPRALEDEADGPQITLRRRRTGGR